MRKLLSIFVVILVIVSLLSASGFWSVLSGPTTSQSPYPENVNTRVSLAPDGNELGEKYRLAVFDDNGNKLSESIDYKNGVKSVLYFRLDGTVREIQDFYPAEDGAERVMKSRIFMMEDGVSYRRHMAFRMDTSVQRSGHRLPDGSYSTVYFGQTEANIERQVVFSQDKELLTEIVFRENGHMAKRKDRDGGSYSITYYRDNGTREYDVTDNHYGTISGSIYAADGESEIARFRNHSFNQTLKFFPDLPNVSEIEVSYGNTSRQYTVFGDNKKARYMQKWKLVSGKGKCDDKGTYVLEEVTKFPDTDFVGIYSWSDVLTITMNEDGTHPVKIVQKKNSSEHFVVDFHDDGSVKKITDRSMGGKVEEFEKGQKFDGYEFDQNLIAFSKVECITIPYLED